MVNRNFTFVGGSAGRWQVTRIEPVIGLALESVSHIDVLEGYPTTTPNGMAWMLRGVTSYERYVIREEQSSLTAIQPTLARPTATCAALIPVKKSASWWALPQDERRVIFEAQSHHIRVGMQYLPAIARRLHHCHDLDEPFDFLTWFEYAPQDAEAFEQLTHTLRQTEEWNYVDREVDIRLTRVDQP